MLDLVLAESADVLAAAHEWNEQRAAWRREWLHDLAVELAECQTLVKGYGDTHQRGWSSFNQLLSVVPSLLVEPEGAARLRILRDAALADDSGAQLERAELLVGQ